MISCSWYFHPHFKALNWLWHAASGEPPLLLAASVHCATREAIKAARSEFLPEATALHFDLPVPATMPVVKELCGLDNVERFLEAHLWRRKLEWSTLNRLFHCLISVELMADQEGVLNGLNKYLWWWNVDLVNWRYSDLYVILPLSDGGVRLCPSL